MRDGTAGGQLASGLSHVLRDGTTGGQLDDGERMGTDGWDH